MSRDKLFRSTLRRYHLLVNKEFGSGLTYSERLKYEKLGTRLDRERYERTPLNVLKRNKRTVFKLKQMGMWE